MSLWDRYCNELTSREEKQKLPSSDPHVKQNERQSRGEYE